MIVVGSGGGDGGEDALELGRLLASTLRLDVLPVTVTVPGSSHSARSALAKDGRRAVTAASVARGLSDVATEVDATALVVGSSHRGRIGRTLFGTGIEHLAEISPCPLAVAPRGYAKRYALRLARIETSFDGSPASERAVRLAGRLAAGGQGSVRVRVPPDLRHAAERCVSAMPPDVPYEVDADASDDLDAIARHRGDMLIVGRDDPHARRPHASALLML